MISIDDLPRLMEHLRDLDLSEVQRRLLVDLGEQLEGSTRQALSEEPGGEHESPWLQTGDLCDSIGLQVDAATVVIGSNNPVAVYQEFGTHTTLPRAFLGPTAVAASDAVLATVGATIAEALADL